MKNEQKKCGLFVFKFRLAYTQDVHYIRASLKLLFQKFLLVSRSSKYLLFFFKYKKKKEKMQMAAFSSCSCSSPLTTFLVPHWRTKNLRTQQENWTGKNRELGFLQKLVRRLWWVWGFKTRERAAQPSPARHVNHTQYRCMRTGRGRGRGKWELIRKETTGGS